MVEGSSGVIRVRWIMFISIMVVVVFSVLFIAVSGSLSKVTILGMPSNLWVALFIGQWILPVVVSVVFFQVIQKR